MREALRRSPTNAQAGKAPRTIPDDDSADVVESRSSGGEHLLNEREDLRSVLASAAQRACGERLVRSTDRHTRDIRCRVDREPGRAHTCASAVTTRRLGSSSYESWK